MMPTEEQVARTIWESGTPAGSDETWETATEQEREEFRQDARAVLALIPPQRCVPSEDEVAEAVAEASGGTVGTLTSRAQKIARAILDLFAAQPTVAQAKAEEALLLTGHEDKGRGFDQLLMRQLADPEVRASYVAAQLRRIKAEAVREAVKAIRGAWDGSWNLRDPEDPETAYSVDVWLSKYADRIERGE